MSALSKNLGLCCAILAGSHGLPAFAQKNSAPIYQDPFDLGAGGASLTRASQVGVLFSNPALLAYGGGFHRWLGTEFSVLSNRESIETVRGVITGSGGEDDASAESTEGTEEGSETADFVEKIFDDPVHIGWGSTLAWITSLGGFSVFSRFEPDLRARQFGATGLPEVRFRAESYHGAIAGTSLRTPWRWLAFGAAAKYLYVSEPDIAVEITDEAKIAELSSPDFVQNLASHNTGVGLDGSVLAFFQGRRVDYSFAGKIDDIGDTKLSGEQNPESFRQVMSAGAAITFHTGADALHLALDMRDIGEVYGEPLYKRVHAGAKLTLRTWVGLSAGIHHGYPSFGAEVDLILLRLSATSWTREMSNTPGLDTRRIWLVSLSAGI